MGPDFFIVGAPKAGTTWLYRNLARNPQIFLTANKEPRYYSVEEGAQLRFNGPGDDAWLAHFVRSRSDYEALYEGALDSQLRGEASSDYLYRSKVAAGRIAEEAPGARFIVLLRDPAHRAHSNWLHHIRDGRETLPFWEAMKAEPERREAGWAWWWRYAGRGFYARQLEPFFDRFPAERILLLTYDELRADPAALLARVCAFLEVDPPPVVPLADRRNQSLVARSPAHRAARRVLRPNAVSRALLPQRLRTALRLRVNRSTLHRPELAPDEYRRLQRIYAADVRRLAEIGELDLAGWTA